MTDWDDWSDADACVDEALAFIDEFADQDESHTNEETKERSVPIQQGNRSSHSKRQRRYRKRRSDEIRLLKTQAEALEKRLNWLRMGSSPKIAPVQQKTGTNTAPCEALASMWKETATRQFQQRSESEKENAQLRHLLQQFLCLAESIDRVLLPQLPIRQEVRHHLKPIWIHSSQLILLQTMLANANAIPTTTDDTMTFNQLVTSLPGLYMSTDAVFADKRLSLLDHSFHDIQVREEDATVDMIFARVMPFNVEATAETVWDMFVNPPFICLKTTSRKVEIHGTSSPRSCVGSSQRLKAAPSLSDMSWHDAM